MNRKKYILPIIANMTVMGFGLYCVMKGEHHQALCIAKEANATWWSGWLSDFGTTLFTGSSFSLGLNGLIAITGDYTLGNPKKTIRQHTMYSNAIITGIWLLAEIANNYIPNKTADWKDAVAFTAGGLIATGVNWMATKYLPSKTENSLHTT